jgi:hypothetical protein
MKKSLLNSIAKNSFLTDLFAVIGILSILGMFILPFFGFVALAFLSTILICASFVLMAQFEANLEFDLKEAKNQLGLSIFTDNKALLKKCLQVQKSLN